MTQNEKDLLIKDLCARLPYGVKVEYENEIFDVEYVCPMYEEVKLDIPETWTLGVSEVKPYLFPLSSMTDEQDKEFMNIQIGYPSVDWFNKNHIDYRDLIERGLAIDATGLDIY